MKGFKNLSYYIIPLIVAFFNILIIIVPNVVISSAQEGLLLWFNKILPSIFPFLIGTNLLIQLGFIDFLGSLLDPLMKKFFNVSGCGAFALILGMLSGYPVGAKITSSLRETGKLDKIEAQRLLSFTNNSGPLFIIGAIGIGMFKNVYIGYTMLFIHYISAITVGILFSFYKREQSVHTYNKINIKSSFNKLKVFRLKNNKPFGQILGDSVKSSLETISIVGGFIILFSVISALFETSGIFTYIGNFILPDSLKDFSNGLFMGFIEITNGINIISTNPSTIAVIIACGLVSFSGLSILAQTSSMISSSDLCMKTYVFSKLLHSIISIVYAIVLSPLLSYLLEKSSTEVFKNFDKVSIKTSFISFFIGLVILFIVSIICVFMFKPKPKYTRRR